MSNKNDVFLNSGVIGIGATNTTLSSSTLLPKESNKNYSSSKNVSSSDSALPPPPKKNSLSSVTSTPPPQPPILSSIGNQRKIEHNGEIIPTNYSNFASSSGLGSKSRSSTTTISDNAVINNANKNPDDVFTHLKSWVSVQAEKQEKDLLDKLSQAKKSLDSSLAQAISDVDSHKSEIKGELKETRNSVLGTIALFAAFFTFVSVNVNIFTKAETVTQSIIFMLSFWLCIIGFVSLFFFFLNKTQDTIWYKSLEFYTISFCIFFTAILMFLLFKNTNHDSYQKINEKISKIESENKELKEENSMLNKKISTQLKDIDEQVIELRKNQYQLNRP